MKRWGIVVLAFVIVLTFAGCRSDTLPTKSSLSSENVIGASGESSTSPEKGVISQSRRNYSKNALHNINR